MGKTPFWGLIFSLFVTLLICPSGYVAGAETSVLEVQDPAICLDVVTRACVDANDVFPANVEKLFCFTKIIGAKEPTSIRHIWYFGDIERANVLLPVRSSHFRTYSSKRIQTHEFGNWHVDVVGPDGNVLKSITFEIVP